MGQQQLLLLTLTLIMAGFATLAGMEAYEQSRRQSAINHITQKALEIGGDVQEYAQRPAFMRPENETSNNELVIDFSELQHYDTIEDGYGGDHRDPYATYSLNGHNSLPDAYNADACPDKNPVNTVEAYSREHDLSVCVSITGTSAGDLNGGVAR